jgi:hypothetical protein
MEIYKLKKGIVKSDIGTMALVYNPKTETFLVLNETAGKLLSLLEQGKTNENMLKGLNAIFKENRYGAHQEYVKNFLILVLQNEIVEITDDVVPNFSDIKLPVTYGQSEQPVLKQFDKKWILENHPDAIYDPAFGDHWSPASGGH